MRVRTARQRGSRAAARFDIDFVPASELLKAERQAGPEGPQGVGGAEVAASIASDDPKRVGKMYMQYIKDHPEARPPNRVVSLDSWREENEGGERVITTPGSPRAKGRRQKPAVDFGPLATLDRFDTSIVPAPSVALALAFTELQRPVEATVKVEFQMLPGVSPQTPFADVRELEDVRRLQVGIPTLPTHPIWTSPMTEEEYKQGLRLLERGNLDPETEKKLIDLMDFTLAYREAERERENPTGPF